MPSSRGARSLAAGIEALVLAAAVVACAAGPARRPGAPAAPPNASADASAPDPAEAPALPSLDALAARGAGAIARMHEIHRVPDASARSFAIEPPNVDACFRAVVVASGPVRARFEDEARVARGEAARARGGGPALVPPHGPACARRGERLFFVVETLADAGPTAARAVLFRSP